MNLLNWVKVMDQKMITLSVEPNLCTHMISPKSTCNQLHRPLSNEEYFFYK